MSSGGGGRVAPTGGPHLSKAHGSPVHVEPGSQDRRGAAHHEAPMWRPRGQPRGWRTDGPDLMDGRPDGGGAARLGHARARLKPARQPWHVAARGRPLAASGSLLAKGEAGRTLFGFGRTHQFDRTRSGASRHLASRGQLGSLPKGGWRVFWTIPMPLTVI
uniref:Uncharacterized protein n=1 Tax=Oryza sativa subsp. japonica TaxID=39947 RepID=Q8H830_ORYSJ|nr:hypothetical protein [Oryza sativa Japonica Group]